MNCDACLSRCSREGRRRNPTNWTYDSVPQPQLLYRGYTMHEMLDEFGLINMNGRCYDPVVGRFLSPDIIVQNPNNTQCYNRYSYAINNPLKYSDPSGWVSIGNSNWAVQMAEMNRALWMNSYTRYCGMKDMFNQMVMAQFIAENGRPEESRGGGGGNSINNVRMFLDVPIMTRIGTFTLRNLLSIGLDKAGHFFSSEKDAYWYMWKRTLIYSVENSAFITQKGVLVLPCYNNEENRGTNCDPQEDKNCKFPFYYKAGWEKNNYYVYPPQNVFSEKLDVIGFIHTHYAFGENEWGGFSPGDWETGRDYFRGLPYFVFGGYNDRSDSKTFDGFYYRNGKGPYSFGEEHFNMLHLFNGLSIINLINKYY